MDDNVNIINLDNLSYAGDTHNLDSLPSPDRHEFIKGDICDKVLVDKVFQSHAINTVIHFAVESYVDRSIAGPAAFIESN